MKTTILKFSAFLLLISLIGVGCEKDVKRDPLCFQGKAVSLNQGDGCQNIIRITKNTKDSEFEEGNTISFDPDLYGGTLKVGDVVYFMIIEYEEFGNPVSTQPCTFPQFAALIEFCDN
jgi:hypothetical protein